MMYSAWYKGVKKAFPLATLGMTDTDSVMCSLPIESEEHYVSQMKSVGEWFDHSEYSKDHPLFSTENAGIPGFFKDEHAGGGSKPDLEIESYCALRAKCYSIVFKGDGINKVTCKGTGSAAKKHLTHDLFLRALRGEVISASCGSLKSRDHHIFQETLKRVALVPFDDKGYLMDNMITCLAHGHYKTREHK